MAAARSQQLYGSNYQPRQPTQARVYSLTPGNTEAEENNAKVVTCTICLFGSPACT
jgi:hypothetical protein